MSMTAVPGGSHPISATLITLARNRSGTVRGIGIPTTRPGGGWTRSTDQERSQTVGTTDRVAEEMTYPGSRGRGPPTHHDRKIDNRTPDNRASDNRTDDRTDSQQSSDRRDGRPP